MPKQLTRPPAREPDYVTRDVLTISSMLARHGYEATHEDIAWAYRRYSEDHWAAGWIGLGSDDEDDLVGKLVGYLSEDGRPPCES